MLWSATFCINWETSTRWLESINLILVLCFFSQRRFFREIASLYVDNPEVGLPLKDSCAYRMWMHRNWREDLILMWREASKHAMRFVTLPHCLVMRSGFCGFLYVLSFFTVCLFLLILWFPVKIVHSKLFRFEMRRL